ncbi:hypothetical protein ABEP17_06465 [Priestia flexa]|uniref:hypothetical protein n=1 Tax=Priestia flexa TaxID=86664 RepID=UPI001CFED661|nr:hypothetical protein [Priestia flexa]MCG7314155.1 hypothetical protein [Priestia flexa]
MTINQKLNKVKELKDFLITDLIYFEYCGHEGKSISYPDYDFFANDYLKFAEYELFIIKDKHIDQDKIHLINCISHLKRAIHCSIDTFLYVLRLDFFKQKNLGFISKLNFLKDIGVFNSFSLSRFNKIRNRMEHEYKAPVIEDIEVYFDLTSAFVAILDSLSLSISNCYEIEFILEKQDKFDFFKMGYTLKDDKPVIKCSLERNISNDFEDKDVNSKINEGECSNKDKCSHFKINVTTSETEEFVFFLKVLIFLIKNSNHIESQYIKELL